MASYAQRALGITEDQRIGDQFGSWATTLAARVHGEREPKLGLKFLLNRAKECRDPVGKSGMLRDAAAYASRANYPDEAQQIIVAVRNSVRDQAGIDASRVAHAEILRTNRQSEKAIQVLGDERPVCPFLHVQEIGLRARLFNDLKETAATESAVRDYREWVGTYGFDHLKDGISRIANQL